MTTAATIISDALTPLGIVGIGDELEGEYAKHGLRLLNRIIDTWFADAALVYHVQLKQATLGTSGELTIGPTGDVVLQNAPWRLVTGCFVTYGGNDWPLQVATTRQQYTEIVRKTRQGAYPVVVYYDPQPNGGTAEFWPRPSAPVVVTLAIEKHIDSFDNLTDDHVFMPGVEQALVDTLTVRYASAFGKAAPADSVAGAKEAKTLIRRMALQVPQLDTGLPAANTKFNILSNTNGVY